MTARTRASSHRHSNNRGAFLLSLRDTSQVALIRANFSPTAALGPLSSSRDRRVRNCGSSRRPTGRSQRVLEARQNRIGACRQRSRQSSRLNGLKIHRYRAAYGSAKARRRRPQCAARRSGLATAAACRLSKMRHNHTECGATGAHQRPASAPRHFKQHQDSHRKQPFSAGIE